MLRILAACNATQTNHSAKNLTLKIIVPLIMEMAVRRKPPPCSILPDPFLNLTLNVLLEIC